MKFVLVFLLLTINILATTLNIESIWLAVVAALQFLSLYWLLRRDNKSLETSLLELMCIAIPISWRNILGGSFGTLPINWFYIIGAIYILAVFFKHSLKNIKESPERTWLRRIILLTVLLSIIPLLRSHYLKEGLGQFITLTFYNAVLFVSIMGGPFLDKEARNSVLLAFGYSGLVTSLGIIMQALIYLSFNLEIGVIRLMGKRISYAFMFDDLSTGSLFLAVAAFAFYLLSEEDNKKRFIYYGLAIINVIGSALTSARTGLIALLFTALLHLLLKPATKQEKIKGIVIFGLFCLITFSFFQMVRPMAKTTSYIVSDSGRIAGYIEGLKIFIKNPLLGVGFGRTYLSTIMGMPMPHFTLIQYLAQTGVFYTLILFGAILYALYYAFKNSPTLFWLLLVTMIGSCVIPDIFSSRILIIIMALIFAEKGLVSEPDCN